MRCAGRNRGSQHTRVVPPRSCTLRLALYFAASDADGKIHIKNIPAGTWEFQFWQEKSGYVRTVTVGGKKTEWKRGRADLKITAGKTLDLGDVVVVKKLFE